MKMNPAELEVLLIVGPVSHVPGPLRYKLLNLYPTGYRVNYFEYSEYLYSTITAHSLLATPRLPLFVSVSPNQPPTPGQSSR